MEQSFETVLGGLSFSQLADYKINSLFKAISVVSYLLCAPGVL